MSEICNPNRQS